jgi:hypothetical protein
MVMMMEDDGGGVMKMTMIGVMVMTGMMEE